MAAALFQILALEESAKALFEEHLGLRKVQGRTSAVFPGTVGSAIDGRAASLLADSRAGASQDIQPIDICFCTDAEDVKQIAVAIESILRHTSAPRRLVFHVVTSKDKSGPVGAALRKVLPEVALRVHHNSTLQGHIEKLITAKTQIKGYVRDVLTSPFNFAAFYLDVFLGLSAAETSTRRLIYLDTDVIVQGEIIDLYEVDLKGKAVAAVEECSQTIGNYINVTLLEKLSFGTFNGSTCIFNRGVFVADFARWKEQRITDDIELWMLRYRKTEEPIYRSGLSQPPWLLALYGRYQRLGAEWNCPGAGRDAFSREEHLHFVDQIGETHAEALGVKVVYRSTPGQQKFIVPFVVTCSRTAKLLHFNGALKPWEQAWWEKRTPATLCALPSSMPAPVGALRAGDAQYVKCLWLWRRHLTLEAEQQLQVTKPVHLCIAAASASDLLPVAVSISSAAKHTSLSRLVVHVITSTSLWQVFDRELKHLFPQLDFHVHHNASLQKQLERLTGTSSTSPFKFADRKSVV